MRDEKKLIEAIIKRVADGEDMKYNPIYICGKSEKTCQLAYKMAFAYKEKHPFAMLNIVSGEEFVKEMVRSVKENKLEDFLKWYCFSAMLVFLNIDAIAGLRQTEQCFYCIFDKLYEKGIRIIVTGTNPPTAETGLADRIRTQLSGGLIVRTD